MRPQCRCFPVDMAKFLRTAFFIKHLVASTGIEITKGDRWKPVATEKWTKRFYFENLKVEWYYITVYYFDKSDKKLVKIGKKSSEQKFLYSDLCSIDELPWNTESRPNNDYMLWSNSHIKQCQHGKTREGYVWPWNYNTKGNSKENSFIKVYWIRYAFDLERDLL